MRVTLLQTDIVWEDKQENLRLLRRKLKALRGVAEDCCLAPKPSLPVLVWTAEG